MDKIKLIEVFMSPRHIFLSKPSLESGGAVIYKCPNNSLIVGTHSYVHGTFPLTKLKYMGEAVGIIEFIGPFSPKFKILKDFNLDMKQFEAFYANI